jgi:hypothetical protein
LIQPRVRLLARHHLAQHYAVRVHVHLAYVSIRQDTSGYVSIRQDTSGYVRIHGISLSTGHEYMCTIPVYLRGLVSNR